MKKKGLFQQEMCNLVYNVFGLGCFIAHILHILTCYSAAKAACCTMDKCSTVSLCGQTRCCVVQHVLTASSACIQAKHLENQIALHDSSGEQRARQAGSAGMLELPLWQQDHIGQMQQKWLERLQRIRECCLPQANPGADHCN